MFKCQQCQIERGYGDGWHHVIKKDADYWLCPYCYQRLALNNLKERIVEAIEAYDISFYELPAQHATASFTKDQMLKLVTSIDIYEP